MIHNPNASFVYKSPSPSDVLSKPPNHKGKIMLQLFFYSQGIIQKFILETRNVKRPRMETFSTVYQTSSSGIWKLDGI
jgi:hypothetical protein